MTDPTASIDADIDHALRLLDPDATQCEALLATRLQLEQGQRDAASTARTPVRPVRHRRRWVMLAGSFAGAAAVVAVIAFGPDDATHSNVPAPDTAEAALMAAGTSAGRVSWTPLSSDQYVHTYAVSFTPEIPGLDGISREGMNPGNGTANESWLGRDGKGIAMTVSGGSGDPKRVPFSTRDKKTGKIMGYSSTRAKEGTSTQQQLAYPDSVNVMAWPRSDEQPYQRAWLRTQEGFLKTDDFVMDARSMGQEQSPEMTQRQDWAVTIEEVDEANANDDPDAAAHRLIEILSTDSVNAVPTESKLKKTAASKRELKREGRIQSAVRLLGRAPLSPNVRKALYQWLAAQPGATIEERQSDQMGRIGTRVTFEYITKQPVPTYQVTAEEILKPFVKRRPPTFDLSAIDRARTYTVAGTYEERRWRTGLIFDEGTGELLEQYLFSRETTVGAQPYFVTLPEGPRIKVGEEHSGFGVSGAQLYVTREVTTDIKPVAEVCASHPEVCR